MYTFRLSIIAWSYAALLSAGDLLYEFKEAPMFKTSTPQKFTFLPPNASLSSRASCSSLRSPSPFRRSPSPSSRRSLSPSFRTASLSSIKSPSPKIGKSPFNKRTTSLSPANKLLEPPLIQQEEIPQPEPVQNIEASFEHGQEIEISLSPPPPKGMPDYVRQLSREILEAIILKSSSFNAGNAQCQTRNEFLAFDANTFIAFALKNMDQEKTPPIPFVMGMIFSCHQFFRLDLSKLEKFNHAQFDGILKAFIAWPIGKEIRDLDLSYNNLPVFVTNIVGLRKLKHLNLCWNRLTTVSAEINYLNELAELNLSYNSLAEFPIVNGLKNLRCLNLSGNQFVNFPPSICALTGLVKLCLNNNCLKDIPLAVEKLADLHELGLSHNPLAKFPMVILALTNLKTLMLASCDLEFVPDPLELNLQLCDLSDNPCFRISDEQSGVITCEDPTNSQK